MATGLRASTLLLLALSACETRPSISARDVHPASSSGSARTAPAPTATASAAVADHAPAPAPRTLGRFPPATKDDLAGTCTAGAAIEIGQSKVIVDGGPYVAIAASAQGVVAAWASDELEVTTIPLDAAGNPRGQARKVATGTYNIFPRLWELGDGMFVLAYALGRPGRYGGPEWALQRVDASGDHVGPSVTFDLDDIRAVTPTPDGLAFLTAHSAKREIVTVTPTPAGLAATKKALPDAPEHDAHHGIDAHLLLTPDGHFRVVTDFVKNYRIVDYEGGPRIELTLPEDFVATDAKLNAESDVFWMICRSTPLVPAVQITNGQPKETELDHSLCDHAPYWSVHPATSDHTLKNFGLAFYTNPLAPGLKLSHEPRDDWHSAATWTGTHFLATYPEGRRRNWTLMVRPITCEAAAP